MPKERERQRGLETTRLDLQGRFLIYTFLYSLLILSQDGRHFFTRPPLPPQSPPTTIIMTKARDDASRPMGAFFYLFFFIFSTYFILGQPPHLHSTTTISTITSNDKGLETRRVSSPLVLSNINPHSHHHINVSTRDCHFRRRCMTNRGSSTGFFLLLCIVYLLKKSLK